MEVLNIAEQVIDDKIVKTGIVPDVTRRSVRSLVVPTSYTYTASTKREAFPVIGDSLLRMNIRKGVVWIVLKEFVRLEDQFPTGYADRRNSIHMGWTLVTQLEIPLADPKCFDKIDRFLKMIRGKWAHTA